MLNEKINMATLKLFNSIQVSKKSVASIDVDTLKRSIKNGYIVDPSIQVEPGLLNTIESIVGISGEKANASFHKSWAIVRDSSIESLVLQQIVHYITTYGFEALGIYNSNTVYIPNEVLELPAITERIPLTVVKAMNASEILEGIIALGTRVALSKSTLENIMLIVENNKFDSSFVEKLGNHELKIRLYDFYDIVPTDPTDFLRYVIFKLTDQSLVIKNEYLINMIKTSSEVKMLDKFISKAPDNLASIFFRYKPLFLAMKSISNNKSFFNKLRKNANSMHKPLPVDYLNSITSQISSKDISVTTLKSKLKNASVFRKVRLAYALNNRLNGGDSIVYKIRNGRGWVTDFEWNDKLNAATQGILNLVVSSIADDIRKNVEGKTIYIPDNVHYALPATEKQFSGNIPSNSYVSVPDDMVIGIHWFDINDGGWDGRVDLDFSMVDQDGKFGWDAYYRSGDRILFSGDNTAAPKPNGASEMFYMKKAQKHPKVLFVNFFNASDHRGEVVPCKLFVANESPKSLSKSYMVDTSNIVVSCNMEVEDKQNVLGLVISVNDENRLYFSNTSIGDSISIRNPEMADKARNYLISNCLNPVGLESVLFMAGANVVHEKPEGEYLDLSPEALDKTTIIKLLQ